MDARRAALAGIISVLCAACSGGPAASPPSASAPDAPATASPAPAATSAAPATPSARATGVAKASPRPTATPARSPSPTKVPIPPKPTGVAFSETVVCIFGFEDEETRSCAVPEPSGEPEGWEPPDNEIVTQTVTWKSPRSGGVEVRVYGVTSCISKPTSEPTARRTGACLVEHTNLPPSTRVLLATAPASAGRASWTWRQPAPQGCDIGPFPVGSVPGRADYYAVVVGAYVGDEHNGFAIATAAPWEDEPYVPGDLPC